MYSYPNYIPLNAPQILPASWTGLEPLKYDRVYGRAFFVRGKGIIPTKGKEIVRRSADRYLGGPSKREDGERAHQVRLGLPSLRLGSVGRSVDHVIRVHALIEAARRCDTTTLDRCPRFCRPPPGRGLEVSSHTGHRPFTLRARERPLRHAAVPVR